MSDLSKNGRGEEPEYHLDEDLCLDLLNDLLPPEERQRALAHMEVCSACERFLWARVSEWERSRSEIKEFQERLDRSLGRKRFPAAAFLLRFTTGVQEGLRRRPVQVAIGLAAAVLVALLLIPLLRGPADEPRLNLLPDISADLRFRTDDEIASSAEFASGLEAYNRQEFAKAAVLLREAQVPAAYTTFRDIYLGSALAWDGQYREAATVLRPLVTEMMPEPWGNAVRWTYFVVLHKSGYRASADSLLNLLAQESDAIGEEARRYLRRKSSLESNR